jgi:hypothetical protein
MNAYLFTTDNANLFTVVVGENETEAYRNAEAIVQKLRPGLKLMGVKPLNFGVLIGLDITILSRQSSDDMLIKKILEAFPPESKIDLVNERRDDGSVVKRFRVDGVGKVDLTLRTSEQVAHYEKNGLNDDNISKIIQRLSAFVKPVAPEAMPEIAEVGENGAAE